MRSRRNCSNDGAERTDDGTAFHARAAVTEKARSLVRWQKGNPTWKTWSNYLQQFCLGGPRPAWSNTAERRLAKQKLTNNNKCNKYIGTWAKAPIRTPALAESLLPLVSHFEYMPDKTDQQMDRQQNNTLPLPLDMACVTRQAGNEHIPQLTSMSWSFRPTTRKVLLPGWW